MISMIHTSIALIYAETEPLDLPISDSCNVLQGSLASHEYTSLAMMKTWNMNAKPIQGQLAPASVCAAGPVSEDC